MIGNRGSGMGRRTPMRVGSVVLMLLLSGCAGQAQPGAGPDSPVASSPGSPGPVDPAEPRLVESREGLVDPRPVALEGHEVLDERTLLLRYYGGVESCYGLDHVDVTYGEGAVTVLVFEGREPAAEVCIEIAELKATRVTLEEPLAGREVVDGTTITEG